MKIGLMHNLYGKYSRGGAETAVKMMAEDLRRSGHEVFLITTRPENDKQNSDQKENKTLNGEKIYQIDSDFYDLGKRSPLYRALWQVRNIFSFQQARQIKAILKSEKPDAIITHNLMGLGFMVPRVLKKLDIRHEHFLHDIQLIHPSGLMIFGQEQKIDSLAAKIYQALTRTLFASPAKVISPSDWLLEIHKQRGFFKDSEQEIRPFVWPETEAPRPAKIGSAKNFIFIGQIEEQKGILFLINAFKKISRPELSLFIAVRNGGKDLDKARAAASGDARIQISGLLSYDETKEIMNAKDYLIIPSLCYENSPTVIYGAHAAGLSVIASRLGGIPELMKKGDELFTPGDEGDLIKKITLATKTK